VTSHRRLRIGGWAALLVAIAAPIEAVVAGFTTARSGAMDLTAISVVEIMRFTVLLIAVVGLDPLFRSLAPDTARPVRIVGVVAAISLIASDVAQLATGELSIKASLGLAPEGQRAHSRSDSIRFWGRRWRSARTVVADASTVRLRLPALVTWSPLAGT
jgi:hypothetical protein